MIRTYKGVTPRLGLNVFIDESAQVIGDVELGRDSSVWFNVVVRGDVNYITIGEETNVQDLSILHVTHDTGPLVIGNGVTVGHHVTLHACTIEDYCLIGMGAIIIDGAVIGRESIVGAGAMVTKNKTFPPRSLIMGSPAKLVRQLTDDEVDELYRSKDRYIEYKKAYM